MQRVAESSPGVRITVLTTPPSPATKLAAFPPDEQLLPEGVAAATAAAAGLAGYRSAQWRCGPALRCRQAVAALGATEVTVDDGLDECDYGSWRGRTLDDVAAADPAGLEAWLTDPDAAPHGGESVRDLLHRATAWLAGVGSGVASGPASGVASGVASGPASGVASGPARTVAVTHPSVVKAMLVVALGAPPAAFWRLDVAPLTRTDLSGRPGAWTVRRTAERLPRGHDAPSSRLHLEGPEVF
ncbi:histidine phosphatase family protein [Cryptosporangium aurantiacum]|uniref:Broad specificity phosphatase PhoE n=1 Tax=Cryptosporangium aurantiacum TaxID=134849 RepID=A0A1M7GZV8_9ACTN|nr:histidine phosphatase family protein [Cryptosporangium aurantiacum]SHM21457.1 Broad specificity phosphatase PhoE [Cryptosporangium aurantiacum]